LEYNQGRSKIKEVMTRGDFLKKLGIAMGASALPMTALATTMVDDTISDDVLGKKIKVFYFNKTSIQKNLLGFGLEMPDMTSRYYMNKQEAYVNYLLNQHGGEGRDVLSAIQNVGYKTKYCLPTFGGWSPQEYKEYSSDSIVSKEVTLEELLLHNDPKRKDVMRLEQDINNNGMYIHTKAEARKKSK
jgi:hypothetical protein